MSLREITISANLNWAPGPTETLPEVSGETAEDFVHRVRSAVRARCQDHFVKQVEVHSDARTISYVDGEVVGGNTSNSCSYQYIFHNQMLYYRMPLGREVLKNLQTLIWLPLATLIRKIVMPIILGLIYPVLSLKTKERVAKEWKRLMPVKAALALIIHPIISLVGLLSCGLLSRRCNILNGDVERMVNGHTLDHIKNFDHETRLRDMPYLMPCGQPETYIGERQGSELDLATTPGLTDQQMRTIARRLDLGNMGAYRPFMEIDGQEISHPTAGFFKEHGCAY